MAPIPPLPPPPAVAYLDCSINTRLLNHTHLRVLLYFCTQTTTHPSYAALMQCILWVIQWNVFHYAWGACTRKVTPMRHVTFMHSYILNRHMSFCCKFQRLRNASPKNKAQGFGGCPEATALRPHPLHLISNPSQSFENICAMHCACTVQATISKLHLPTFSTLPLKGSIQ